MNKIVTITGTYGALTVDAATGEVLSYTPEWGMSPEYDDVLCVDLQEWRQWTAANDPDWLATEELDFCDVGFWTDDGVYVEASPDFRHAA